MYKLLKLIVSAVVITSNFISTLSAFASKISNKGYIKTPNQFRHFNTNSHRYGHFLWLHMKNVKMSKNALDTRAQLNRVKLEGQTVSPVSFMKLSIALLITLKCLFQFYCRKLFMKLSNATSSNEFSISHFIMWKVYSIVSSFDRLSSRKIMQLWIRSCSWQTWSLNVSNWTIFHAVLCKCSLFMYKKPWVFVRPVKLTFLHSVHTLLLS